jgi:hypothetical protein
MTFLEWLENSPLSMWIKESESFWPYDIFCLSMHSVGMAVLVGFSTAFALRGVGYAPRVPIAPLRRFVPVIYVGFWMAMISGAGLFITYPVKAVRNPIFWLKMAGVVVAVLGVRRIIQEMFHRESGSEVISPAASRASARVLIAWLVTISAGRLLAYEGIPSIEWVAGIGMIVIASVAGIILYLVPGLRPSLTKEPSNGGLPARADVRSGA